MDLTTVTRVKVHHAGQALDVSANTFLGELIDLYSLQAEKLMCRTVTTATYTEYLDVEPGQAHFTVKAWPISTMSAVYHDTSRDFDVTAISSDSYTTYTGTGEFVIDKYALYPGPRVLKVVYQGGMSATGGATFATAYPDIANAIEMQVKFHFDRKDSLGRSSEAMGPGTVAYEGAVNWLPGVKAVLLSHKRYSFGR